MNKEQISLLNKMKELIREGKYYFANRNDRDYVQDLLDFGLIEEQAWIIIYNLNSNFYYPDSKPKHLQSNDSLTFKRKVNGLTAYIKLKIEYKDDLGYTVCLSFHLDNKKRRS